VEWFFGEGGRRGEGKKRGKDGFDVSRRGLTKEERKKRGGGVNRERRWGLGE